MKKITIVIISFFILIPVSMAQDLGLKTNFAHWGVAFTPNVAIEITLNRKYTIEVNTAYNAFDLSEDKKIKHWLLQPEFRYWIYESYDEHFFGIHLIVSQFNIGGVNLPIGGLKKLKEFRYDGTAYGAGLSYGYQFPVSKRLNFELGLGLGYSRLVYDKFECTRCGKKLESDIGKNYFGITKAALSLVYLL